MQLVGGVIISCSGGLASAASGVVLANLGGGAVMGVAMPACCAIFPRHRTTVCGVLLAGSAVGSIVAGTLIIVLIDSTLSWRGLSGVLAALTVLAIAGGLSAPRRHPAEPARTKRRYPLHLLRRPAYLAILTASFLNSGVLMAVSMWLPDYVASLPGANIRTGAAAVMVNAVGCMLALCSAGLVAKLVGQRRLIAASCLATTVVLLAASMIEAPILAIGVFTLFGMTISFVSPTIIGHAGDRFPAEGASLFSLIHSAGNLGGVAGPFLMGVGADAVGKAGALRLSAAMPLVVLAVVVTVVSGRRASAGQAAAATVEDDRHCQPSRVDNDVV